MRKRIQQTLLFGISMVSVYGCQAQEQKKRIVSKNGMEVRWHFEGDRIFFELSAPTTGWATIGFNTSKNMKGAYQIMGHVVNGNPNVVEHCTIAAGNYKPIEKLGAESQLKDVKGNQNEKIIFLWFSLPVRPISKYQRNLNKGMSYTLILAYSQEDDFQHHSIMRTSIPITL